METAECDHLITWSLGEIWDSYSFAHKTYLLIERKVLFMKIKFNVITNFGEGAQLWMSSKLYKYGIERIELRESSILEQDGTFVQKILIHRCESSMVNFMKFKLLEKMDIMKEKYEGYVTLI